MSFLSPVGTQTPTGSFKYRDLVLRGVFKAPEELRRPVKGSSWSLFTLCLLSFDGLDEKFSFFTFVAGLQSDESGNDLLDPGSFGRWSPVSHRGQLKAFGASCPLVSFFQVSPLPLFDALETRGEDESSLSHRISTFIPQNQGSFI